MITYPLGELEWYERDIVLFPEDFGTRRISIKLFEGIVPLEFVRVPEPESPPKETVNESPKLPSGEF